MKAAAAAPSTSKGPQSPVSLGPWNVKAWDPCLSAKFSIFQRLRESNGGRTKNLGVNYTEKQALWGARIGQSPNYYVQQEAMT